MTAANVYAASSGGSHITYTTSGANGYWVFWADEADYAHSQRFKIIVSGTNYQAQTYDNITIFTPDDTQITISSIGSGIGTPISHLWDGSYSVFIKPSKIFGGNNNSYGHTVLFAGPDNLVVDGPSDILYLQILSEFMHNQGRTGLDPRWTLVPAGGIEKIPAFIALLGGELNISVLLKTATGGDQRIGALVQRGIRAPNKLIPLAELIDVKEADIEDLFETDFYLHLLKQSGMDIKGEDINTGGRIRKRIETNLGRPFNHYQPAAHFLRNQASLLEMLNTKTLDRFEHLFKKINTTIS